MKKLPPAFDTWRIKKSFAMSITPTLVVLLQEIERFNRLVERMLKTLSLLQKALAGEIGMDVVLDNIANSLFNGQIPDDWRKLAPDTCKPLSSWMDHLSHRATQYRYWSSSGEPLVMWLSGLHVPESFLTALVQIACRKNNWPLDRSTLFTVVTDFADPDDVEERSESVSSFNASPYIGAEYIYRYSCLQVNRFDHSKSLFLLISGALLNVCIAFRRLFSRPMCHHHSGSSLPQIILK